ncbi:hypothetical protein, partial [Nonomuraea sp. NPDC049784]|uniref:hypothetical protein n=1 Tax=Nonomuraea sp. NPDC049784 TaxID=3154361 RepID=UPI0033D3217E
EAWRITAFCLTAATRHRLGLPDINPEDIHQVLASSRRFYRAFDRLTTVLDPARHDRRARLPPCPAERADPAPDPRSPYGDEPMPCLLFEGHVGPHRY